MNDDMPQSNRWKFEFFLFFFSEGRDIVNGIWQSDGKPAKFYTSSFISIWQMAQVSGSPGNPPLGGQKGL